VRRYRAERLLRDEFERLRDSVIGSVCGRLRAAGVSLDASDVDVAYAQAWQGLYAATLEGQQIVNPSGWLALVTYRRAIDEHRARRRMRRAAVPAELEGKHGGGRARTRRHAVQERDLADELDDRTRLRQLFEALRGRLSAREQQAATLCYLQGLSRSEAAARMGVSESRMRKLMEGRDTRSPGVAGKVGALVETIRAGAWCEEQGSLMRGFAYGILDPGGERYRLALIHRDECPACRAYVLSLRGLAAVLPPVPSLLHLAAGAGAIVGKGAGVGAGAGFVAHSGGSAAHSGATIGTGAVAPAGSGAGGGALSASASASAAAGASAAGGGWLLAGGPVGAKLAVGCLLALGVGAGCVALGGRPERTGPAHRRDSARDSRVSSARGDYATAGTTAPDGRAGVTGVTNRRAIAPASSRTAPTPISAATRAGREFGPEQVQPAGDARSASARAVAPTASTATSGTVSRTAVGSSAAATPSSRSSTSAGGSSGNVSPAQREFLPG
jgi:RNA polymerase sigma factor (sigma-70 family)